MHAIKQVVSLAVIASLISAQGFANGAGDSIRAATKQSHVNAKLLAENLLLTRMGNVAIGLLNSNDLLAQAGTVTDFKTAQIAGENYIKELESTDPRKANQNLLNNFNAFYNGILNHLYQNQSIENQSRQINDGMIQFAGQLINICKLGESNTFFIKPPATLTTPQPEFSANIKIPVYSDGKTPGITVGGTVATPEMSWDAPGIAGALTAATLSTFTAGTVLAATAIGGGVTLLIGAVIYIMAFNHANEEAADISAASLDYFNNQAGAEDVADHYRQLCKPLSAEMSEFIITSAKINQGDEVLIAKLQNEAAAASTLAKDITSGKRPPTLLELQSLIKSLMVSIALKNKELIDSVRSSNIEILLKIKRTAMGNLKKILYAHYFTNISAQYENAIEVIKGDIRISIELEAMRADSDKILAKSISKLIMGQDVHAEKVALKELISKYGSLLTKVKSQTEKMSVTSYFRSLDNVANLL